MTELADILRRRIADEGPLPVSEFMGEALANPRAGYYTTRDPFGQAGDFTTAPEISQMFGELIGLWCAVVWQAMGAPAVVRLVELGPGRGTLMADMLRAARAVPAFHAAVRPHLVEISPALRTRQEETLARLDLAHAPAWHGVFEEVPDGPMLLVANEFFDALPIRQFERTEDGWRERLVTNDPAGGFCFTLKRGGEARLGPAPEGSVQEICPAGTALAGAIGQRLTAQGGAALIIDYGHAESGFGDTLQAVRDHAYADILADPGQVDLTAHVDFEALANAAELGGADVWGPLGQGYLLMALGIEMRARVLLERASEDQRQEIATAHHRLVHPEQMGTLFKALALTQPGLPAPPGFDPTED